MAAQDWYTFSAGQRLAQIEAEKAQCLADLQYAKANGGDGADSVQRLADLSAQARNVHALHDEYIRSQQPPPRVELTQEQRQALGPDQMTWWDHGLEIARNSKHGWDLTPDDPNVRAGA